MIRNLKMLVVAAFAVLALGAVGAASAQAAAFTAPGAGAGTVTDLTITPDGTGKTAHQVLDIYNATKTEVKSITCKFITGHTEVTGESVANIEIHPEYQECEFIGVPVTLNTIGCNYNFFAEENGANNRVEIKCGGASKIEFGGLNCHLEIGSQTLGGSAAAGGITYHNINPSGTNPEVTVSSLVKGITYTATGTECPYGTQSNGELTTGNAILTGEQHGSQVMRGVVFDGVE